MADRRAEPVRKFVYTRIPGMAPYKGSDWSFERTKSRSQSVDAVKRQAESDPGVAYFFHATDDFTLEKQNPTGTTYHSFSRGDSATYGDNLWLGTAAGKGDTYLVAELHDTSDPGTRAAVLAEIQRHKLKGLDTSAATTTNPQTVKMGLVYCAFKGSTQPDIASVYQDLMGGGGRTGTEVQTFVARESGRRVSLSLDEYRKPGSSKAEWLVLDGTVESYANDLSALQKAVDAKIEFPADWQVIVLVVKDPGWTGRSRCNVDQTIEGRTNKVQMVLLGPDAFTQSRGAKVTTAHELMHALSLRDLYTMTYLRSFGWSAMSDVKTGWHLTEWEKLSLGWVPLDDFLVLRRGIIPFDRSGGDMAGKRGIIVLPDPEAGRTETYVLERAQEIGRTEQNRSDWASAHATDPGILMFMFRPDGKFGWVSPFAHSRPQDAAASDTASGGAALAAVPLNGDRSTNGIRIRPGGGLKSDSGVIGQLVSVAGNHRPGERATVLREGQKIVSGTCSFGLTTTGALVLDGAAPFLASDGSVVLSPLYDTGFGHSFSVDRRGRARLAAWHDDNPPEKAVLKTFDPPPGTAVTESAHWLALDLASVTPRVGVYRQGADGKAVLVYHLFQRAAQVFSPGWTAAGPAKDGQTLQASHEKDWNLVVRLQPSTSFVAASTTSEDDMKMPAAIVVAPSVPGGGRSLLWLAENGYVLRTTPITGDGPYQIGFAGVSDDLKRGSVVLKTSSGATAATLLEFSPST